MAKAEKTVTELSHYDVVRSPIITEKSTMMSEHNQVAFQVAKSASKPEIKAAVEAAFKVDVTQIRVLNVKGKTKRTRTGLGRRSDWKKAYVRLAAGQEIDFTTTD